LADMDQTARSDADKTEVIGPSDRTPRSLQASQNDVTEILPKSLPDSRNAKPPSEPS